MKNSSFVLIEDIHSGKNSLNSMRMDVKPWQIPRLNSEQLIISTFYWPYFWGKNLWQSSMTCMLILVVVYKIKICSFALNEIELSKMIRETVKAAHSFNRSLPAFIVSSNYFAKTTFSMMASEGQRSNNGVGIENLKISTSNYCINSTDLI